MSAANAQLRDLGTLPRDAQQTELHPDLNHAHVRFINLGKTYDGIHRISFLLDGEGKVEKVFDDFKTSNHHDIVVNWLKERIHELPGSKYFAVIQIDHEYY